MSIHLHKQLSLFAGARLHLVRSGANEPQVNLDRRMTPSANLGQVTQLYWPDRREQTVQLVDPDTEQSNSRQELGVAH